MDNEQTDRDEIKEEEKTMTMFEKALGFMPNESIDCIIDDKGDGNLTESDLKIISLTLTDKEFEALPEDVKEYLAAIPELKEEDTEKTKQTRKRNICKRCGSEYKKGDSVCGNCFAPTYWKR